MREIEVKKRDWVKNAAIIFLAVMLVLTFFSNTIMNRSLPEVAAQYTQAGTITSRIRGSGNVTANEIYRVRTDQSYEVEKINAKKGEEVSTGDVLIVLSKAGSDELETAREALREAELKLERFLIENKPEYISAQFAILSARTELTNVQEDRAKAQEELVKAQNNRDSIGFDEAAYRKATEDINTAQITLARRQAELSDADNRLRDYEFLHGEVKDLITGDVIIWGPNYDRDIHIDLVSKLNEARQRETDAQRALDRLEYDKKYAEQNLTRWDAANKEVINAEENLTSKERAVVSAQQNLDRANAELAALKEVQNTIFDIDIREMEREIDELKAQIEELESTGMLTEITSPVNGRISDVLVTLDKKTEPNEPLVLIEVIDMGYTLSIPVTALQSSKVNIGDTAEVDRGWWSWGEPINAVLAGIRPDPQNPGGGRLLVFNISGDDIDSDTTLNITISQRSENYGIIVPNSAVRSDANGDFVLIVETRSSPLRNRYIARRVDVTVIASDDINSAISGGGLSGWDFVITTSTRPIEPGMQIRLTDNP